MHEELTGKLRHLRRSMVMQIYTFHFESVRLELVPCKENIVRKIGIALFNLTTSSTLNCPIMVESTLLTHMITAAPHS